MSSAEQKKIYTEQEYLELERKAYHKSEYFKGEIFAMSGASRNHNVINTNLLMLIAAKLKGKGCQPFANDMRLHPPLNGLYTYPDLMVVCGKEEFLDNAFDTLLNPVFIAEILSPSTADYDTGKKFTLYRSIPTLKEFWAISSYEYRFEKFVKNDPQQTWTLSETTDPSAVVTLSSLNIDIGLEGLYDGVRFREIQ